DVFVPPIWVARFRSEIRSPPVGGQKRRRQKPILDLLEGRAHAAPAHCPGLNRPSPGHVLHRCLHCASSVGTKSMPAPRVSRRIGLPTMRNPRRNHPSDLTDFGRFFLPPCPGSSR